MNEKLSILSLLFDLFLCVIVFSACGGDDESSSGDNGGSESSNIPETSAIKDGNFWYDLLNWIILEEALITNL